MNVIYDAKRMRQHEDLAKMKNCADDTMICIYYLVWGIILEISNQIAERNPTQRNSDRKPTTMSRINEI